MIHVDSDPPDPTRDPQLALVFLLKAVLQITEFTLLDLTSPSFMKDKSEVHYPKSKEDAYITALFLQIHSLDDLLDSYCFSVQARRRALSNEQALRNLLRDEPPSVRGR
jgi:hypothetical protein